MLSENEKQEIANRTAEAIITQVLRIIFFIAVTYVISTNLGTIILWILLILSLPSQILPWLKVEGATNFNFWTNLFWGYCIIIFLLIGLKGFMKINRRNKLLYALSEKEQIAFNKIETYKKQNVFLELTSEEREEKFSKYFREDYKSKNASYEPSKKEHIYKSEKEKTSKNNKYLPIVFLIMIPISTAAITISVMAYEGFFQEAMEVVQPPNASNCDTINGWGDGFGECHCNPLFELDTTTNRCIKQENQNITQEKQVTVKCSENSSLIDGQCICNKGFIWDIPSNVCVKKAYIFVVPKDNYTVVNGEPFFLEGFTSDNCSKITVFAKNDAAHMNDVAILRKYQKGDTTFTYGISTSWKNEKPNLAPGKNDYIFQAYCDNDQTVKYPLTLNYTPEIQNNSFGSSSQIPSFYGNPGDTSDFDMGNGWAEENDIDNFADCQNEFGTGSAEDGCNEYVKKRHVGYSTFKGYDCTEDCSGHEAGYEWAQKNGVSNKYDCGGSSQSFIEGCESYVEENQTTSLRYNYMEDKFQAAEDDEALRYNYMDNKYEFAEEDDELKYNYMDNKYEYADSNSDLRYNYMEDKYQYADPDASLHYDPIVGQWSYEK